MLYPPGFYFVKKPKRFVILSSDKSSERNLSSFFDINKPRRIEHLQSEEPFSSDPYFSNGCLSIFSDRPRALLYIVQIMDYKQQYINGSFSNVINGHCLPFLCPSMHT